MRKIRFGGKLCQSLSNFNLSAFFSQRLNPETELFFSQVVTHGKLLKKILERNFKTEINIYINVAEDHSV